MHYQTTGNPNARADLSTSFRLYDECGLLQTNHIITRTLVHVSNKKYTLNINQALIKMLLLRSALAFAILLLDHLENQIYSTAILKPNVQTAFPWVLLLGFST
jgi:hypothetical protein